MISLLFVNRAGANVDLTIESCISIDELTGFDCNEEIFGCTDFIAFNYNPAATADDGNV